MLQHGFDLKVSLIGAGFSILVTLFDLTSHSSDSLNARILHQPNWCWKCL